MNCMLTNFVIHLFENGYTPCSVYTARYAFKNQEYKCQNLM